MGSKLSPAYANIFMGKLERISFSSHLKATVHISGIILMAYLPVLWDHTEKECKDFISD